MIQLSISENTKFENVDKIGCCLLDIFLILLIIIILSNESVLCNRHGKSKVELDKNMNFMESISTIFRGLFRDLTVFSWPKETYQEKPTILFTLGFLAFCAVSDLLLWALLILKHHLTIYQWQCAIIIFKEYKVENVGRMVKNETKQKYSIIFIYAVCDLGSQNCFLKIFVEIL